MNTDVSAPHRVAETRTIRVALGAVVAFSVASAVWGGFVTDDPLGIVASQLSFTPDRFTAVVRTWDVGQFLALTTVLDFAFPAAYGLAIGGVWARARGGQPNRWTLAVPSTAVVADWLENILHMSAAATVRAGESPSPAIVGAGSAFATLKWVSIIAAILTIAVIASRKPGRAWRATALTLVVLAVLIVIVVIAAVL